MILEIDRRNPAIPNLLRPFLVVLVVGEMKIQYIFPDQNEPGDLMAHQVFNDIPLQIHDIIVDRIVPFTQQFDHAEPTVIINIQQLDVKGGGADIVPLRMDIIIVDAVAEFEFAVFPAVKR